MCFRPAGAARVLQCPECGAYNRPDATKCQKCGFEVPPGEEAPAPAPRAPGNAPVAPPGNAPGPGAPSAPSGAPKAPGATPPAPPAS